jgi:hypothetical protein
MRRRKEECSAIAATAAHQPDRAIGLVPDRLPGKKHVCFGMFGGLGVVLVLVFVFGVVFVLCCFSLF